MKLQSALVALKISLTDLSKFIFEKETDQPIGFCVLDLLQNSFFPVGVGYIVVGDDVGDEMSWGQLWNVGHQHFGKVANMILLPTS